MFDKPYKKRSQTAQSAHRQCYVQKHDRIADQNGHRLGLGNLLDSILNGSFRHVRELQMVAGKVFQVGNEQ